MLHPSPDEFAGDSTEYGSIGRTSVELSELEYQNDRFILSVREQEPSLARQLSRKFPRRFREKVDFTVFAIASLPKLRRIPIGGMFLDLHWLQYQLDELYDVRNSLAHGAVFSRERQSRGTIWKIERVAAEKNVFEGIRYKIGDGFLADIYQTAHSLRIYLLRLEKALSGEYGPETAYRVYKESEEQRRAIQELIEIGVIR